MANPPRPRSTVVREHISVCSGSASIGAILGGFVGRWVADDVVPDAVLMVGCAMVLVGLYSVYAVLEWRQARQPRMTDYFAAVERLFVTGEIDEAERRRLRGYYLERYWRDVRE